MDKKSLILKYVGSNFLRQRLVLSVLSGRTVIIENIRTCDLNPGLREYEASLIRLLDKMTNGTYIEINSTGTKLTFKPGLLHGGTIDHDCCIERGIGYYMEVLVCLAPFCKIAIHATLNGVTNNHIDPSVDSFRYGTLAVLKKFLGTSEGLDLSIVRRGLPPDGGGEVVFRCPIRSHLEAIQFIDPGKICSVKGVAFAAKVSPFVTNRMVTSAKGVLLRFLANVYIDTDHCKGIQGGRSHGFGITLVAETLHGSIYVAEAISNVSGSEEGPSVPEDIGKKAAHLLLEEIFCGGCFDSTSQSISCLFMAMGQSDVSKILTGPLSPYTIQLLRHIKDYFQMMFKLQVHEEEEDDDLKVGAQKVLVSCLGIGYSNLSRHRS